MWKWGNAAYFDGFASGVNLGTDARNVDHEVSLLAWIKPEPGSGSQWIAGKYNFEQQKATASCCAPGLCLLICTP